MGQHDPTRPNPYSLRPACDLRNHYLWRRTGQPIAAVMLGKPVAVVTEPVDMLGQRQRIGDGICGCCTGSYRRLVKNTE